VSTDGKNTLFKGVVTPDGIDIKVSAPPTVFILYILPLNPTIKPAVSVGKNISKRGILVPEFMLVI